MQTEVKSLYDQDFNLWRETTIKQIQERRFQEVDWEHLLEELEDMGKSDKRAFKSNIKVLLAHLLKLKVQADAPDSMKKSWYDSVTEHRDRLQDDLSDNPSFKSYFDQAVETIYKDARNLAIKQGRSASFGVRKPAESEYPLECPFSLEQILDGDFYGIS